MSTVDADARPPQRPRGHLRVAAILAAGEAVFQEQGYDAATMTEIAARSGTAFGSLYRFFPSKAALADALLKQYAQHALDALDDLAERAPDMPRPLIADALFDFALSLHAARSFAVAAVGAQGDKEDRRARFRRAIHDGVTRILRRGWPDLPDAERTAAASVLLHVIKGIILAAKEGAPPDGPLLVEYRNLAQRYLAGL